MNLIQTHGLERLRESYVKQLEGPPATGHCVVVVHVFVKKTQKTPRREIETARRRAKEVR